MTPSKHWVNGEFLDSSTMSVSSSDHGFLLGDGVFETLAVRDSHPEFLDRHLQRLRHGIDRLSITPTATDAELAEAIVQLLSQNDIVDARVRMTVTPGPGTSPRHRGSKPLTVITASPIGESPTSATLCSVPWIRNERSVLSGIKSTSWGENASILRHAQTNGFDNAFLCDSHGRLSECTSSNIFLVLDDQVVTPPLSSGCLPGIIRGVLIDGTIAIERDLFPSDFASASEVFITSSVTRVVPISRVDDLDYQTNGPATAAAAHLVNVQASA